MLHKIEKKVLHTLLKQPNGINIEAEKFYPYPGDEVRSAMNSLRDKGYLESVEANIDLSLFHYSLSTQGRFYKEYRFHCFMSDIFIPAVVAVITSLITYFLCG